MKKPTILFLTVLFLLVSVTTVSAAGNRVHANLVPNQGPADATGNVSYTTEGESLDFTLTAAGLLPNTEYTVRSRTNVLGSGTTNSAGNLQLNGSWPCTMDLIPGRINLWDDSRNEWTMWTGAERYSVFDCTTS